MITFSDVPASEWLAESDRAFAFFDAFPVSPGHALIVTKRVVPSWWSATADEQRELVQLIDVVKALLDERFEPDGYNVGFNAGAAAGQTVDHLHIHVIPRYRGDVHDPRGGIRHVIPGKGNYLAPSGSLVTPKDGQLLRVLREALADPAYRQIDLVVAFVMLSGVNLLADRIESALRRGARIRLLTTDYLLTTDAQALGFFFDRLGEWQGGGHLEVKVFSDPSVSFHPKAYLFLSSAQAAGVAYVGSSNLSQSALRQGVEWNLRTHSLPELADEFEALWRDGRSRPLTAEWLSGYRARQEELGSRRVQHTDVMVGDEQPADPIAPWSVQREAMVALETSRHAGHNAGLVVMATGLGKTWLAAFDSTRPEFRRVLFIAHREEILTAARDVFRRVRPGARFGMFTGSERTDDADVTFASIQSLQMNLDRFAADSFDYIVVDEFHHAAAPTYRRVIGHFNPKFLLGLTATPDRTDAADLLALCGDNLVYECGLLEGLRRDLLSPFAYRAIRDVADYAHIPWRSGKFDPEALSSQLETSQRAQQVFDEWSRLGGAEKRSMGFCCSIRHAEFMQRFFTDRGVRAVSVHSGPGSADRVEALAGLEAGDVDVVFTVDLFNEGIDVPSIDVVLMLRPTDSAIVFFQQLGRGLRRADGKERLEVLDLVGNHRSFLLKARLLAALSGRANLTDREAVTRLSELLDSLPSGCSIVVDTEVVDLMQQLLGQPSSQDRLAELARQWASDHGGVRPAAMDLALVTGTAHKLKSKGGWFGFMASLGLLTAAESNVYSVAGDILRWIENGVYQKSYKLVTLGVLVDGGGLGDGMPLPDIALAARWRVFGDPRLAADLHDAGKQFKDVQRPTEGEWAAYWRRNPIKALLGEDNASESWFVLDGDRLRLSLDVPAAFFGEFESMVAEMVDYRLHRYLRQQDARGAVGTLTPRAEDGSTIDAKFLVELDSNDRLSVVVESSGGKSTGPNSRNSEYTRCLAVLLERLEAMGAVLEDVYVDSKPAQRLDLSDRRLVTAVSELPIALRGSNLDALQRGFLNRMRTVGRRPDQGSGGNNRKRMRLVLSNLDSYTVSEIQAALVNGPGTELHTESIPG